MEFLDQKFIPAGLPGLLTAAALALLLPACASNSPQGAGAGQAAAGAQDEPVPELTLNLPKEQSCACDELATADYTFLDKGLDALLDGEYIEAVQYFQRYQRLESSPRADWEAGIAIAYVSMLPRSPFYDPEAARNSFAQLRDLKPKELQVHEWTRLMRQSLLNFLIMERHVEDLEATNATLKEDLDKREEALKRLRELTLGQKAAIP